MSKMVKKIKFSAIAAGIATLAIIAAVGSLGGGLGQQQQVALAQVLDSEEFDEANSILEQTCEDLGFATPPPGLVGLTRIAQALQIAGELCEAVPRLELPEG